MHYEKIKNWEWYKYKSTKYLTSKILNSLGIKHGYFNRIFSKQGLEDISQVFATNPTFYRTDQVHGNSIAIASEEGILTSADGLINKRKNQMLCIYTADCIPVLIADKSNGRVCACHAGWRGIAKRLIPNAIEKLRQINSKRNNLIIAMGPAISSRNYCVRKDVTYQIFQSLNQKQELNNNQNHLKKLEKR